ncbi:MAG: arginine--tRNA ligase [Alphaproteobacteria bacterium]
MNIFNEFKDKIRAIVEEMSDASTLPTGLDTSAVTVEPPRDSTHGDLASNVALVLAKQAGAKPRDIANAIGERLAANPEVEAVEIAGPGSINLRLTESFWHDRLGEVLAAGAGYGQSDLGGGRKVNVEYVSVNPTGPLHVGHARGAVFGDALSALLEKAGYDVTREYYINDLGSQIDTLARSTIRRYGEALGKIELDESAYEGLYPGDYLVPVGRKVADEQGDRLWGAPDHEKIEFFIDFTVGEMMALIRDDLASLGVVQDVFTSERAVVEAGKLDQALGQLDAKNLIYSGVLEPPKGKKPDDWEPREQTLFRATNFGDDVDRPLKKSDGSWTYFAGDIANHLDKIERGFVTLINVWGADHGGHVKRMKAAVAALSDERVELDVKLCQMVKLLREGQPVKMSKRSGDFITLRDVVDEVGKDVVRFIMLTRKNDAPLEFDLVRVTEQSKDNPVFYVQYAHARVNSVLRNAAAAHPGLDTGDTALAAADLGRLTDSGELALIKLLTAWPRQVESAAEAHEPHRLAFYLYDVAAAFHGQWNRGNDDPDLRFIVADDKDLTMARLALSRAVASVIASGLEIFGVEPVEEMR